MHRNSLSTKAFYLCKITDEQLSWRNCNGVFNKLYVFYCVVNRNFLDTVYFRGGKKYCSAAICEHGSFIGLLVVGLVKIGFERERSFMIQIFIFQK